MHVLYLHQYFVPPDGSGGTRSYEMARRFVLTGHEVTLITSSAFFPDQYSFKKLRKILLIDGIELRVLHVPYSNQMSFIRRILAFFQFVILAIVESFRIRNVDIVFATSTPLTIAIPGVLAKLRHCCPMVFEVRDLWPEMPIALGVLKNFFLKKSAYYLERWAYYNSSQVVALSQGMKEGVVAAGYPESRVSVVPNSSDIDLFRGEIVSAERFKKGHPEIPLGHWVVYAGTIGKVNGIDYFAKIANEMKNIDMGIQFVIVGEGMFKPYLYSVASELNVLNENFWILPSVPKSKLPDVLAAATVASSFVIDVPELWNNSANKFFDAFAAKKPIIINHEGWQANFIRESGAGLIVPPNNPKQAAHLLCDFLNDGERLACAIEAADKAACEVFDRDLLARKLINVLEGVCSG